MIDNLLPAYYAIHGTNPTYTVLRTITIDGHEVVWVEFIGTVVYDITGQGREGELYTGRGLYCECDFTEGVGWKIKDDNVYNLDDPRKCLYRKTALHLRHLELRQEYLERFQDTWGDSFALHEHIPEIILDLIEKAKAGEFIEDGNGASFWGGYFYLQTVAVITDQFVGHLWEDIHRLVEEHKIGLVGAVIQSYREPPPPLWEEFLRVEEKGWIGIASLPGHRQMAREWKLEVLKPDGTPAYVLIPGLFLSHDPVFGPDVKDVVRAKKELRKLIRAAKKIT